MIYSMTGYGKGEHVSENRGFTVEIKAVNNKFCEFNIRMPRFLNTLEERLRQQLSGRIFRGRVDVNVSFETHSARDVKIVYNEALAEAYHKTLSSMVRKFDLEAQNDKFLELIARFPDVVEIDRSLDDNSTREMWDELSAATSAALDNFTEMRKREGAALKNHIEEKRENIAELLGAVESAAPLVVQTYREKLKKRMEDALSGIAVDEVRFLNEVAHFADKASIDEEIARLKSHIAQLSGFLSTGGTIGRKLDFLAQEMAREANTIGSKANSADISKVVIELKSEIEKIREQVQNIE